MKKVLLFVVAVLFCSSINTFAADKKPFLSLKPRIKQFKPSLKKTEQPKNFTIRISGSVRQPQGRGIGKAKIKLYEWIDDRFVYAKEVKCKKNTGAYSINLDEQWLKKGIKLVPQIGTLKEGEFFIPHEKLLNIETRNITNVNFLYPHEYMPLDE